MADHDEFRQLFESNFDDLWRFARRRCVTSEDADDVTAETFAVAWRRRDELASDDVRLWLFGVARLVVANQKRGERRRERLRLQLRLIAGRHKKMPDPADRVVDASSLRAALASLNDDDRDVVLMRCWDGLGVHEIAVLLGCSANAVSVRLYKIRQCLIEQLNGTDPDTAGQVLADPLSRKEQRHA
jgi:RNA polymerase sigma-70 factor (ECF subfamily)